MPRIKRQSGMRSCSMPGLPTHLVQEVNIGTVLLIVTAETRTPGFQGCRSEQYILYQLSIL